MPIAIESKFLEPYDDAKPQTMSTAYLERTELWAGLSEMKRMAEAISIDPRTFRRLGAAQLMKHTLGLSRRYGPRGFRLYYLWYLVPGESAAQHQVEVERFAEVAIREIEFVPMTYQDLFRDLQQLDEPVPGYIEYLADRYFSEAQ